MTTTPVTSTPSTPTNVGSNISNAQQSLAGDQQTFLKLLTTQLQHQDPMKPMDTDQFTQQLVAMTGVQQQILTNELLQQLVGNQTGVGDPVSLLGKSVTATTGQSLLQAGKASWQFSTDSQAADVLVTLTNNLGQTVASSDLGPMAAGDHSFTWNGKDTSGVQMPDGGAYTLTVTAKDVAGADVASTIFTQGTVTAVNNSGGQVMVNINGVLVPANAVTAVTATQ